ncbi:phosphoglycerol geranylgeranyltransferase [Candidatus Thalassarchaeum betae]|uniref:phosphoglycerol geranylgeranyltransferase n=1 Tax=Candidatus Thalassarchaeum betae TaxID=2599289 RepID=UPI0030C78349|nr:phosphoglycerol geranylgeranyltransferase [Candidatus Thalassoarchaea betae]
MTNEESWVLAYVCDRSGGTRHAILIDPADQSAEVAAKRCVAAVSAGSRMILVGGSSGTDSDNVHDTITAIREALELITWASSQDSSLDEGEWQVPIVLFPQGAAALSPAADGITFMMLMNSTSPRFLIEEQTAGAPFIREAGIETLPMGYVICAPGGRAGQVGQASLIEAEDDERVKAYAMAAESYGFRIFYLEAGSGASHPVAQNLIRSAKEACDLTLVVGGGIRDGKTARLAAEAGADWIITGNLAEEFDDADKLHQVLTQFINEMNGA